MLFMTGLSMRNKIGVELIMTSQFVFGVIISTERRRELWAGGEQDQRQGWNIPNLAAHLWMGETPPVRSARGWKAFD